MSTITISYMSDLYTDRSTNELKLRLGKVDDDAGFYDSFEEFAADYWLRCTYPAEQSNKQESYGFTPTLFEESTKINSYSGQPEFGRWRTGRYSSHDMSLMYLDCDNDEPGQPYVSMDTIQDVLTALNYSHMLYASYSDTEAKPKTRAIIPLNRDVSFDEGFLIYVWFNHLFQYQMDGSIYDDGDFLFGPTFYGEKRQWLDGDAIDADAILYEVEKLPDEALTFAMKRSKRKATAPALTAQYWVAVQPLLNSSEVDGGASILNPDYCRREWLDDFDVQYKGGSHRQSMFGTMMRIWCKSKGRLTMGEMKHLRDELDARQCGYCQRKYGLANLNTDLRSVMLKAVA